MEKEFVLQLVDFNESITDKFGAKKERRMDVLETSTINNATQSLKDAGSRRTNSLSTKYVIPI